MMFYEIWAGTGSAVANLMIVWAMAKQFLPPHFESCIARYPSKIFNIVYPYITITFLEYSGQEFMSTRNEAYTAIESYLSDKCTKGAKRLKANMGKYSRKLQLIMDDNEEVSDEYKGVRVKWHARKIAPTGQTISLYSQPDDRRYYKLVYHKSARNIIDSYLEHVMEEGKAVQVKNRQRKLYINNPQQDERWRQLQWSHVPFKHPATFETIAMDPEKKKIIEQDLEIFVEREKYYSKVGKLWKRGYLLYGPPGTGKSTMIAAMANKLNYDVYDLELTAVKDNTALIKLLIETTSKSIIVIEDIDCSLDLSGERKIKQDKNLNVSMEEKLKEKMNNKPGNDESKVTLSGLLNVIDGLWSTCVSERLIVFTTNYKEKLDQALIRTGRMDMHIELSYCRFEAFKILARNYLSIEDHELFKEIKELIEKNDITPADVAEKLMPKSSTVDGDDQIEDCLKLLIEALKLIASQPSATNMEAPPATLMNLKPSRDEEEMWEHSGTQGWLTS